MSLHIAWVDDGCDNALAQALAEREELLRIAEKLLEKCMCRFEPGGTAEGLRPPFSLRCLAEDLDTVKYGKFSQPERHQPVRGHDHG